jgi:hypothetical protein
MASILDKYPACEEFLRHRASAFSLPYEQVADFMEEGHKVYGIMVDTPLEAKTLITVAAMCNGAANLYVNTGGGILGAAQRHKRIAATARNLIHVADNCIELGEKTTSFDLPTIGFHFVYLFTTEGPYKIVMTEKLVAKGETNRTTLFNGYQALISELRYAQMKEMKAGQK